MANGIIILLCIGMLSRAISVILLKRVTNMQSKQNTEIRPLTRAAIDWTKPRAYIIHMSGNQTAMLCRAAQFHAERQHRVYIEDMRKKHGL